mgnify:CR=1 FL=1
MAQPVLLPQDASSFRSGQFRPRKLIVADVVGFTLEDRPGLRGVRRQPCSERGKDWNDPPRRGAAFLRGDDDVSGGEIHVRPVEALNLGTAQAREGTQGDGRREVRRGSGK